MITTFVDPFDEKELEGAIRENTKAVFLETLGNPNSDVVDIEGIARIAHAHKIPLVVDNTDVYKRQITKSPCSGST